MPTALSAKRPFFYFRVRAEGGDRWGWVKDFPGWPTCAAFSPDAKSFAVGTGERLKAEGGYQVLLYPPGAIRSRRLRGEEDTASSIAFSPDGLLVACSAEDGTIRVWFVETGEHVRVFEGIGGERKKVDVNLSFSPDGKDLVLQVGDQMRVFEVGTALQGATSSRQPKPTELSSVGIWHNTYQLVGVSKVETVIKLSTTNESVAWFPAGLERCLAISPDRTWALTQDSELHLIELLTEARSDRA